MTASENFSDTDIKEIDHCLDVLVSKVAPRDRYSTKRSIVDELWNMGLLTIPDYENLVRLS